MHLAPLLNPLRVKGDDFFPLIYAPFLFCERRCLFNFEHIFGGVVPKWTVPTIVQRVLGIMQVEQAGVHTIIYFIYAIFQYISRRQ